MSGSRLYNSRTKEISAKTLNVFETISYYFAEIYFSHLYDQAKKMKNNGKVKSVTEGYRQAVFNFLNAMTDSKKPEHMHNLFKDLNKAFQLTRGNVTMSEMNNIISSELIPIDYYPNLNNDQKRGVVKKTFKDIITKFTELIADEYLSVVIDNRDDHQQIVKQMSDSIVDILKDTKYKYAWEFASVNKRKHKPSEDELDSKVITKMRNDLRLYEAENKDLTTAAKKMCEQIQQLRKNIQVRDALIRKRAIEKQQLDSELLALKSELNILKESTSNRQPTYDRAPKRQQTITQSAPKPRPSIIDLSDNESDNNDQPDTSQLSSQPASRPPAQPKHDEPEEPAETEAHEAPLEVAHNEVDAAQVDVAQTAGKKKKKSQSKKSKPKNEVPEDNLLIKDNLLIEDEPESNKDIETDLAVISTAGIKQFGNKISKTQDDSASDFGIEAI
jgi:hypothetical protein